MCRWVAAFFVLNSALAFGARTVRLVALPLGGSNEHFVVLYNPSTVNQTVRVEVSGKGGITVSGSWVPSLVTCATALPNNTCTTSPATKVLAPGETMFAGFAAAYPGVLNGSMSLTFTVNVTEDSGFLVGQVQQHLADAGRLGGSSLPFAGGHPF